MQSAIHSTCCWIDTIMLVSTDGLPGPVIDEQVGEPDHAEAEVGAGPGRPGLVRACWPSAPADVDAGRAPVMASKPVAKTMASSSWSPAVVRMPVGGDAPRSGDSRRSTSCDVGPVEGLVVAGVDAQPLAADHLVRGELVGHLGVLDDLAELVAHELGGRLVGGGVDEQVVEGAEEGQPAVLPAPLELRCRSLGRRPRGPRLVGVHEPGAEGAEHLPVGRAELGVVAP